MAFRTLFRALTFLMVANILACGRVGFDQVEDVATDASMDATSDLGDDMPSIDLGAGADAARDDAQIDAEVVDMPWIDAELDADGDSGPSLIPGILVSATSGLVTTEGGGMDTYSLVLRAPPTSDVTIAIASSDSTEGTADPAAVTFTPDNWNAPQVITVTGVDDVAVDGAVEYTIQNQAATSSDSDYSGLEADDVEVTNIDDETPGITVTPTSDLVTSESGGDDTFTVVLNAAPLSDVSISLSSSDTTEISVSPSSITFTALNWNAPQTITVVGVDDPEQDGDVLFTVIVGNTASADAAYNDLDVADVTGRNRDDESPSIVVELIGDAETSEAGASTTVSVVLLSQPTSDVLVPIASSDETEGTVSPSSIVFSTTDWNVPHAITVAGANDAIIDGNQPYTIHIGPATSGDSYYHALSGDDVALTNRDDDMPGYTITELTALSTTEGGGSAQFSIVLNSQPTANVIFAITSSDTSEVAVANPNPALTPAAWFTPIVVTLTGVNDPVSDGNQIADIRVHVQLSADTNYMALSDTHLSVTNLDDETPGVTITPSTGLTTTEAGGSASFTVVLNSQPSANVTLGFSSDTPSEGTVLPASVTFTTFNWSMPRTVTVTGANDLIADGARVYHVVTAGATSADSSYMGLNPIDVTVTNTDNDTAGLVVTPTSVIAPETGVPATFSISLRSQPTASVTVPVHMLDEAQGTLSPASRTFTTANWSTPQSITVTGINDGVPDGVFVNTAFTDPCVSADMVYAGLDGTDVSVTHTEMAGIAVTPLSGLTTSEAGGTAMFSVVLTTAPAANVGLYVYATSEGRVIAGSNAPIQLIFTPGNWNVPQNVTIYGVDDLFDDGDVLATIVTGPATSSDPGYQGLNPPDVTFTNVDNDTANITITPVAGSQTSEDGGWVELRIAATTLSAGPVTLTFTVSDPSEAATPYISGSGASGALTTYLAPSVAQSIFIRGLDDFLDDGDVDYQLLTNISTADPGYSGVSVAPIALTNLDNDSTDIILSPSIGALQDVTASYTSFAMVLARAPSANVVVGISSSDTSEMTVPVASLTFTPANWNAPQYFQPHGVTDGIIDGDQVVTLVTAPATSTDGTYAGVNANDATITVLDYDNERLISTAGTGTAAGGFIGTGGTRALSYDGRYIAFDSAGALVAGDTNAQADVFLRDRTLHTTTRQSVTSAGAQALGSYGNISRDGRYIAFTSWATNLVAGDSNGHSDAFLRDTTLNTTERVSLSSAGTELGDECFAQDVSTDGRFVLFQTLASAVPSDTNGAWDLYVRDRMLATTSRVSVGTGGAQAPGGIVGTASMSADGRYVAFSTAAAFVPADTGFAIADVYVRDTLMGTTSLLSVSTTGTGSNQQSTTPVISADGRYVAFSSGATNLIVGDSPGTLDIFVRDTMLGTTTRINVATDGSLSNQNALSYFMSDDGQRIVFISAATNLAADDTNGAYDAFVRDRLASTTTLVTRSPSGTVCDATPSGVTNVGISGDGHYVSVMTNASNLLNSSLDTNFANDVYTIFVP